MQLDGLMEKLRLEHLEAQLDTICEQASERDLGYREFLTEALQSEWNGRHLKGVESRLKMARFPWIKTIEQFDLTFQPSLDPKLIRELAGLSFVERAQNVILLGPPGVGKTHLAVALGVKAVEAGHRVLFMTLEALLTRLSRAHRENRLDRQLQQLVYPKMLIIDEQIIWLGSINISQSHLQQQAGGKGWRDTAIRIEKTDLSLAIEAFNLIWYRAKRRIRKELGKQHQESLFLLNFTNNCAPKATEKF